MNPTLLVALLIGSSFANIHEEFQKFKADFGKTYSNKYEEGYRKGIFAKHHQLIEKHNEKYAKGEVSYYLGINYMSDLLAEEIFTGLRIDNETVSSDVELHQYNLNDQYPKEVDWRQKGAVTPVKDQGQCGSCWSFSTTGTLEGAWAIKTGQLVSLSEEYLVECIPYPQYNCQGCRGGLPWEALRFIKDAGGIDGEQQYPYVSGGGQSGQCAAQAPANQVLVQNVVMVPQGDEQALQSAVASAGPVSVGISGADGMHFVHYQGGIFADEQCNMEPIGHAVLAVGYGTDPLTGMQYWLVKNSWGVNWGEQGYIRMVKGYNMCRIADSPTYPVV